MAAYATLGYETCQTRDLEPGKRKIAIYAKGDLPTHAARQLPTGEWTSKLGRYVDIGHALTDLEGEVYGTVAVIMSKADI